MPKIEVNERQFFDLLGERYNAEQLDALLQTAKAELDEWKTEEGSDETRTIKIELNDTNRPDLWTTAGLARQLRVKRTGKPPVYDFFSSSGVMKNTTRKVIVEESVRGPRPWLAGFIVSGMEVTDASLKDMIQTQEKLAWNFGRKRRTVSIGLYRTSIIQWPVLYKGVDPDSVSFVPLQETRSMTLRQILSDHPKGREYAFILKDKPIHPLLADSRGSVLSYPPIINSADLGAVKVGDTDLFIEVTGTDMSSVCLTVSIMACDLSDLGFTIEPVMVEYPFDTPFGRSPVFPYYFQEAVTVGASRTAKLLGKAMSSEEVALAVRKMGNRAEICGDDIIVFPAEYRNDFLHPVDIVEDVMIGMDMESFEPERPRDFTIGRLSPIEIFSRKAKRTMVGLGFQEMIYNYLGSRKDYADRMGIDPGSVVRISNPMTENVEFVRNSPLPGLLGTESISSTAAYPHRTCEVGKVAVKDETENYGVSTRQTLGFMISHQTANYNEASGNVATLFYYLGKEYRLVPSEDCRFIPGRQAGIFFGGMTIGVFGEIHPCVLEAWGITMPCIGGEINLDALL
ncbi:MAG: phenylalanine--tRNA ligase subunit beta [Rectinemataceae bacterium]|nr:phenylalanine--tRNA ligase subunit beta [Rectinemataceae bacterium]